MEPLIFKIETQADDSGVRQYDKSLSGLDVSSKKASGALKSFSQGLLQAKSGADVAAAGAESLSRVLEKSLAGAVVIGGIKIVSDQINKMSEILRSSGEAASAAITQLERMGEINGIEDATRAAGLLNGAIDNITKSLGAIQSGNWFTQITGSITGTTEELGKLLASQEKLRDITIASGFAAERNKAEAMSRLNAEQKKYEEIQETLKKRLEIIDQIKDADARASAIRDAYALAGIENLNLQSSLMAEQSKKEEEASKQRQKEIDARIQKEAELGQAQQKRFNDLYNAEVKAQEDTQIRIDANLKAEEELAAKLLELYDALAKARQKMPLPPGGGGGTIPGDPTTSAQVGQMQAAQAAYIKGLKDSEAQLRQYVANQLKANGLASDSDAVNRKLRQTAIDLAYEQGLAKNGVKDFLDGVRTAEQGLRDFEKSTQDAAKGLQDTGKGALDFATSMSSLLPAFDKAVKSAENLADSITKNTGSLVDDFLKTGDQTTDVGKDFNDLGTATDDLADKLKEASKNAEIKEKKADNTEKVLKDIHSLLDSNLKEMRTYAFVK